jgi:nucleoside-diphosphate-sugar epimerase
MARRTVLVTGMSGLIGGVVRKQLEGAYELRGLNRSPIAGVKIHQADIADLDAIRPAFEGVDTVVHLAAVARGDAPWDEIHRTNVVGTYNVFEAARAAGVKRVIFASSGATVSGYERESPYAEIATGRHDGLTTWPKLTHESPVRPTGLYGASKVWGEALARHYADGRGLSAICLRIGHVTRDDRPHEPRDFSVWLSQRDIAQMVQRSIEAPAPVRFDIFFVVSDNRWSYRDLEHPREVVGFAPLDRAEDHR